MKARHPFRLLLLLTALLGAAAYGVHLYFYINDLAQPVLTPVNQAYSGYTNLPKKAPGLHLDPFTFTGWDGGEMQAVLVTKEGEESSRQLSVIGDLAAHPAENLSSIDYALVCVDWDHGICSSLPLAETLTAAGIPGATRCPTAAAGPTTGISRTTIQSGSAAALRKRSSRR